MDTKSPLAAAAAGQLFTVSNKAGRGDPDIKQAYSNKCSCHRGKATVFCRSCGYCRNGRIRLRCEQHPRVTFLLDMAECPRCRLSAYLEEY